MFIDEIALKLFVRNFRRIFSGGGGGGGGGGAITKMVVTPQTISRIFPLLKY